MTDSEQSRAQLLAELNRGRRRVAELEAQLVQSGYRDRPAKTTRSTTTAEFPNPAAMYQSLVEQLPAITYIVTFDDPNRTTYISPQIETILGFSPAEWLADQTCWIRQLHSEDRERVLAEVRRKDAARQPLDLEYRVFTRDGRLVWFRNMSTLITDEVGQVRYAHGVLLDITAGKRTEWTMHRYAGRLKVLHEITLELLTAQSPEVTARKALAHIERLIPCQWAGLVALNFQTRRAWMLATQATDSEIDPFDPVVVFEDELLTQGQVMIDDLETLSQPSPLQDQLRTAGLPAYLAVPLVARGQLIGSLKLAGRPAGLFGTRYADIAAELAAVLALIIQQARFHQQVQEDAQTKLILLHEVNHRVKNHLAAIIGLIEAERDRVEARDLHAQDRLQTLANRVRGLSTVHTLLSLVEWAPLPLSQLAEEIIHLALESLPPGKYLAAEVPPAAVQITPRQANSLALIIHELALNSVKYALSTQDIGRITVRITREEGRITLTYRDDGPGYPEAVVQQQAYHTGLQLVADLLRFGEDSELRLYNDQGAVAEVRFKAQDG